MSVPSSLLPTDATGVARGPRTGHDDPHSHLDRVHDHVLRLLGDEEAAARVAIDVAVRADARVHDLGEAPTFESLVRLAHARLASMRPAHPSPALVARLAGDREPGGPAVVNAVARADRRGAALLDLTARHDVDVRRAAAWIGVERAAADRAHSEALRRVRAELAANGSPALDVATTLGRLPVVDAPAGVHRAADLAAATDKSRPLPAPLAWLGTAAAVMGTLVAVTFGLPALASGGLVGAPVVTAEGVAEGPAADQLATPGDDVSEGDVEQLVIRGPAEEPAAPPHSQTSSASSEPSPEPEPSPTEEAEPAPEEEPTEEPSPEPTEEPSFEPSEGPLDELLPTDP